MKENADPGAPGGLPTTGAQLTTPPNPCTGCALVPTTFTRTDGQTKPYVREFPGDPAADYLLIVQDDGKEGTRAEIKLNGETVIASSALYGLKVAEIKKSVVLRASNRLTVLPLGAVGARVVVWILGGAEVVGQGGGDIRMPGGTAVLSIPPGVLSSPVQVAIVPGSGLVPPALLPGQVLGPSLRLEPDGLAFSAPVTLTIDYSGLVPSLPAGAAPSDIGVLHWSQQGTTAEVLGAVSDPVAQTLTVTLSHFSFVSPVYRGPNGWATYNVKWAIPTLTWYLVAPSGPSYLTTSLVQAELATWELNMGAVRFQPATSLGSAQLVFHESDLSQDQCPLVFSIREQQGLAYAQSCFSFLASFFKSSLGSGDKADLYVDSRAFTSQAAAAEAVRHVIGHALGIAHPWITQWFVPPDPQLVPVMQAEISVRTGLDLLDITALQYLYGSPTSSTGWHSLAGMSSSRQWVSSTALNGLLYAVGGYAATGVDLASVEVYAPTSNTWTPLASLPEARYAGDGLAAIGGKLYLPGGFVYPAVIRKTLHVYDVASNTWTSGADMPVTSGCGASGVISQQLYVFTGCIASPTYAALLHRYDPGTNQWSTLQSPTRGHTYPAAGVIGGKFYLVGGYGSAANVTTGALDIYDPGTNTWTAGASMPTPRASATAQVVNGRLYVIGGQSPLGQALNVVEEYDPASDSWSTRTLNPAATSRWDAGSGAIGGRIYVTGGTNNSLVGFSSVLEAFTP